MWTPRFFPKPQMMFVCDTRSAEAVWALRFTWGLVTSYGEEGTTKWEGGACEVFPLRKGGGAEKVLAILKGGRGTDSFGVPFIGCLKF